MITSRNVLSLLIQALLASPDVMISSQTCASKSQREFHIRWRICPVSFLIREVLWSLRCRPSNRSVFVPSGKVAKIRSFFRAPMKFENKMFVFNIWPPKEGKSPGQASNVYVLSHAFLGAHGTQSGCPAGRIGDQDEGQKHDVLSLCASYAPWELDSDLPYVMKPSQSTVYAEAINYGSQSQVWLCTEWLDAALRALGGAPWELMNRIIDSV